MSYVTEKGGNNNPLALGIDRQSAVRDLAAAMRNNHRVVEGTPNDTFLPLHSLHLKFRLLLFHLEGYYVTLRDGCASMGAPFRLFEKNLIKGPANADQARNDAQQGQHRTSTVHQYPHTKQAHTVRTKVPSFAFSSFAAACP